MMFLECIHVQWNDCCIRFRCKKWHSRQSTQVFINIFLETVICFLLGIWSGLKQIARGLDLPVCRCWFTQMTWRRHATNHFPTQRHANLCRQTISLCVTSLCNHVTLYGLASPRLLHSLNDHIKSSHSFKHGCNNGRWVVLYALVSPQWPHAWFWGRVRTILFPATKLCPCVNKLSGSM